MKNIVICDIDNTLTDARWRNDLRDHASELNGAPGSWDVYHGNLINDQPNLPMVALINILAKGGYYIIGLTSRPEKWRALSNEWFGKHGIYSLHEVSMRADDDYRPAHEIKIEFAKGILDKLAFVFDDDEKTIAQFSSLGVLALQVHLGGQL